MLNSLRRHALRALYSDDAEARRYIGEGFVYFGLIHAHLALVLVHVAPVWTLPLLTPVWMARLMIGRHELIHVRKEDQVDFFTGLWPVLMMVTPFSAGFREYRVLHQRHHQYLLTEGDPDVYQIRGSVLSGFFHCLTSPEQTVARWVLERGIDPKLAWQIVARSFFFFGVAALCGPTVFVWYWLPLRLTYGASLFMFSYVLHRRGPRYGVFRIELSRAGVALFVFLFGRAGWLAVCNHDVHHMNGNLSPRNLIEARALLE
jgi:fatty acid desaturase